MLSLTGLTIQGSTVLCLTTLCYLALHSGFFHTPHTHSLPCCWSLYGGSRHCASPHCAPLCCAASLHCASLHCGAQCPLSTTLPPASLLLLAKLALVVMTAKCSAPCSLVCRLEETVEPSILCTSPAHSRAPEKSSHVLKACLTLGRR